jgi:hypothetical protein
MINPLALLAVFFGTTAIILLYALLAMRDTNEQLRQKVGTVPPPCPDLQDAALDLIVQCTALELRNDYLEAQRVHCQDIVAMSIAQSRIPRRERTKMVSEKTEYLSNYPR